MTGGIFFYFETGNTGGLVHFASCGNEIHQHHIKQSGRFSCCVVAGSSFVVSVFCFLSKNEVNINLF
jgi:hypothetical protein